MVQREEVTQVGTKGCHLERIQIEKQATTIEAPSSAYFPPTQPIEATELPQILQSHAHHSRADRHTSCKFQNLLGISEQSAMQILDLSKDELSKFVDYMQQMGINSNTVLVQILPMGNSNSYVDSLKNYEMDRDDLIKTFGAFGEIKHLRVNPQGAKDYIRGTQSKRGHCLITFSNIIEAFCAQQYLDGYDLPKYNATMSVRLLEDNEYEFEAFQSLRNQLRFADIPFQEERTIRDTEAIAIKGLKKANVFYNMTTVKAEQEDKVELNHDDLDEGEATGLSGIVFLCRFDILIDVENDFDVKRRIMGAKGCNMKRIVELCNKGVSQDNFQQYTQKYMKWGQNQRYLNKKNYYQQFNTQQPGN